jgi:hypothetical protein
VIVLLPPGSATVESLAPQQHLQVGQRIGRIAAPAGQPPAN